MINKFHSCFNTNAPDEPPLPLDDIDFFEDEVDVVEDFIDLEYYEEVELPYKEMINRLIKLGDNNE